MVDKIIKGNVLTIFYIIMDSINSLFYIIWCKYRSTWCQIKFMVGYNYFNNHFIAVILVAIILMTGSITYNQSAKADALMEGFKNFLP
jgi:hypothetical protein